MSSLHHLTFLEAGVVGLIQGITELFPVSSIGHNVLVPDLVGGTWARDLNVGASESDYLAFIVGMHVATATALLVYFWREWVGIIAGFFRSFGQFLRPAAGTRRYQLNDSNQRLAWLIVLATIPVGLAGLAFEHEFRVITGHAIIAAYFLIANGLILLAGEKLRRPASLASDREQMLELEVARGQRAVQPAPLPVAVGGRNGRNGRNGRTAAGRHAAGHQSDREDEVVMAALADRRLSHLGPVRALLIGATQILALLAGISRDGVAMVGGMFGGLSRQDAARFSFLLATPVIFAAGALKLGDLFGPLGNGIRGEVLFGSVLSGVGAYFSVRFLMKYFRTRTLTPFAAYCFVVGLGSIIYVSVR